MSSPSKRLSLIDRSRRIARRELLAASARVGVGAMALALVGAEADAAQDVADERSEVSDQLRPRSSEGLTFPFVGPYSGNPPTLDPYENLTYRTQIPSGYHYSKLIQAVTGAPGVSPINTAEYEPDLAAAMPEMPDETTYIFRLRNDAHWHDVDPVNGRAVTTEDIAASYDRYQETSRNAPGWNNVVAAFDANLDNSITVRLHRPYAPFLTLAGSSQHLWIIPPEIVDDGTVAARPVGSGAWIFESYEPDVALNWSRNPSWHRKPHYRGFDVPLSPRLTATLDGDTNVLIPALADGWLDFSQLSPAIYKQTRAAAPQIDDGSYVFTPNTVPGGFYFNYSIPPWNDVRVRQALSLSMDRDGILAAIDETGRGGWHGPFAQLPPYWMDPKDLGTFGETFEGEDSGILYHRDTAKARRLLDAAGFPDGIQATLHSTADYGATVVNLYEACASSAAEAGFQFEFFFKEYAAYIASIFRGNFPDGWDGESSHLAIGPLYGGATDPDDIFAAVYARSSVRHNWGAAGRTPTNLASILGLDTGGNAEAWSHPNAVSGGGPETDERLHQMFARQKTILDFEERVEYINDIQRYMATKMYMVPYVATPGVHAFNPWVRQLDYEGIHPKATYGIGQEFLPGAYVDRERPRRPTSTSIQGGKIVARRLADGRIEFGFQPAYGARVLPRARFFPANARTGQWLTSSTMTLNGVAIGRISARRLADGRTEFTLLPEIGERVVPRVRFFPAGRSVTNWLSSSAL